MKTARMMILLILFSLVAGLNSAQAQGGKGGGGGGGGGTTTVTSVVFTANPTAVVGSSSVLRIDLLNSGGNPLTINTITISGPEATDYSLGGTCTNGAVLPKSGSVGAQCTLQITFSPQAVGARTAAVNATFLNAPALTLPLNGQGMTPPPPPPPPTPVPTPFPTPVPTPTPVPGPEITIFPGSAPINFVPQPVGRVAPIVGVSDAFLSFGNLTGRGTYTFSVIGANPGDFLRGPVSRANPCVPLGGFLAPNQFCELPINFMPTAVGARTATLRIITGGSVIDIPLSGEGTPALPPPPPPPPLPIVSATDFTDLWGVATEADWSLGIMHHKTTTDVLVAFWHTYDVDGRDMWLELTDGHWVDSLTYTGNLHRPTGPSFSLPDNPSLFVDAVVGTATLSFTNSATGTFSYTVNGTSGSKTITRVGF